MTTDYAGRRRRRPRRHRAKPKPLLTVPQILDWADDHFERSGRWPMQNSEPVGDAFETKWNAVDVALRVGLRGLVGGSSLARLLSECRGVRNRMAPPLFTAAKILAWADAHFLRTGAWPKTTSGPIVDAPGESWMAVDAALRVGTRGLSGGSSLAQLLTAQRGVRNRNSPLPLTIEQVLIWADDFIKRTGRFPSHLSGAVALAPGETWSGINQALSAGFRGFEGGSSLSRLLVDARGKRHHLRLPRLTIPQILTWVDSHHARCGRFPSADSGPVVDAPGETWRGIEQALRNGRRGLTGSSSLARFLAKRRRVRNRRDLPKLSIDLILDWADIYRAVNGRWPSQRSGVIVGAHGETWSGVNEALFAGLRGLCGGSSLARLLAVHRGKRHLHDRPPLSIEQILVWADAHFARAGGWPGVRSGEIDGANGETWKSVCRALRKGTRGLRGGSSLARVLAEHRGVGRMLHQPSLTELDILKWADSHFARRGCWPHVGSGPIAEASWLTWCAVNSALRAGLRGSPGGSSLATLLRLRRKHRGVKRPALSPNWTENDVLAWADAHLARTGQWPNTRSGPIVAAGGKTWRAVDHALNEGNHGLKGGSSLAKLLAARRGKRNAS